MGKHNNGPVQDSPELMQRCLNCPYPPECCHGEKKCLADYRINMMANWESIVYGKRKGISSRQIAREIGVSENYIANFLHHYRKKTGEEL